MTGETPREPRRKVRINARMRIDSACVPVMICDVSSRGALLRSPQPPPRGAYVELMRPGGATVARVVWSSGASFGVQTREKLDVAALTNSPESALEKPVFLPDSGRKTYVHGLHHREASNWLAGRMQFVTIAAAAVVGAVFGGLLVFELLNNMSAAVAAGMH